MYFLYYHFDGQIVEWYEDYYSDRITQDMVEGSYYQYKNGVQLKNSQWNFSRPVISLEANFDF
jgi:hypothetical protein